MTLQFPSFSRFFFHVALLGLSCGSAVAQTASEGAMSLHLAQGKTYQRATLNWEGPVLWTRRLGEQARVELNLELGLSHWRPRAGAKAGNMSQLSAVPMWRFWLSPESRLFFELGIGPSLLSRKEFAGRNLSTNFQFADHVGLGYAIDDHTRLGLRYSHFSNASIKRPNPGLDIIQLTLSRSF